MRFAGHRYAELASKSLVEQYVREIEPHTSAFRKGMQWGCGDEHVLRRLGVLLGPADFGVLLGGVATIDVQDWQRHTKCSGEEAEQIETWFWEIVRSEFSDEQRAALLRFATGSSCVPAGGFTNLLGYQGQSHPFELQVQALDAASH